jgi:hypothetical protein
LPGWQDPFLFGESKPWTGQRVAELVKADQRWRADRGSDVDRDPVLVSGEPVPLNDTDEKRAAIVLRYRLYTHQPDEMTVLMALRSMRSGAGGLDPQLYQYGGLFLYPIGAMLKLYGLCGWVTVGADLPWYLDHPEEFGRFYVVARTYVLLWSLAGVFVVFAVGRRLARGLGRHEWASWGGVFGALLYVLMPVVVNMAHEAKPHLPAAVLMLTAVLAAAAYVDVGGRRRVVLVGVICGAAFGMVLSSWPIFIIVPLMTLFRPMRWVQRLAHVAVGVVAGTATYAVTNPFILINLVRNRDVLRSNFGNSLAMYQVHQLGEGLRNVLSLMGEGMSGLPLVLGLTAAGLTAVVLLRRREPVANDGGPAGDRALFWLLMAPAVLIFVQFVALGAGKPGEYGRFALFPDIALAIAATAFLLGVPWPNIGNAARIVLVLLMIVGAGEAGVRYRRAFENDSGAGGSRYEAALTIKTVADKLGPMTIGVFADPAPYCMPPVDLFANRLLKLPKDATPDTVKSLPDLVVTTTDDMTSAPVDAWRSKYRELASSPRPANTRISWANKPIVILLRQDLVEKGSR